MNTYTAHLRAPALRPAWPILVREGWTGPGFLFGPLWLLAQRAWIPAILDLAAFVLLFALAPAPLRGPGALGLALLVGLLGRDMQRWSLARRGFAERYVVLGSSEDAALARLLAARPELLSDLSPAAPPGSPQAQP